MQSIEAVFSTTEQQQRLATWGNSPSLAMAPIPTIKRRASSQPASTKISSCLGAHNFRVLFARCQHMVGAGLSSPFHSPTVVRPAQYVSLSLNHIHHLILPQCGFVRVADKSKAHLVQSKIEQPASVGCSSRAHLARDPIQAMPLWLKWRAAVEHSENL